jgi:hypothetical protein
VSLQPVICRPLFAMRVGKHREGSGRVEDSAAREPRDAGNNRSKKPFVHGNLGHPSGRGNTTKDRGMRQVCHVHENSCGRRLRCGMFHIVFETGREHGCVQIDRIASRARCRSWQGRADRRRDLGFAGRAFGHLDQRRIGLISLRKRFKPAEQTVAAA